MLKFLSRIAFLGTIIGALFAQSPPVQWTKTIRDYAICDWVQETTDKGFILAGFDEKMNPDGTTGNDFYLLKTDSSGNFQWEKTFDRQKCEGASSVQQTGDGGYIIAGVGGDSGGMTYLVKTDSLGNKQWEFNKYGWTSAHGIQQTNDGGYIVAGLTGSSEGAIYIIKIDSSGNEKWRKIFPEYYKSWVAFIPVRQTMDRGYIIGAEALIKTDSLGNIQWRRAYNRVYVIFSVQQATDRGYIATGIGANEANPRQWCDICLLKTDSLGNLRWKKTFGGSEQDAGRCVIQTRDKGYIISGETDSYGIIGEGYIIKTDSLGNCRWTKNLGVEHRWAWCIQQTIDGGYIVTARDRFVKLAPERK